MSDKNNTPCLNIEEGATSGSVMNSIAKRKENKQKPKAGQKEVEFEDGPIEYLEQEEVDKSKATQKVMAEAQEVDAPKVPKARSGKKQKVKATGESSTAVKKKNKPSDKKEKPHGCTTLMMRASNDPSVLLEARKRKKK
ncbi:unnamed protein product [Sphenostylis stenocarpa]|uniref:Uncharacterized protein n=1 Tax=Sphenostylis stenocarpa TaxID=92480 RepID=A0AA86VRC0_9FABA|nr:unnamed protein product [Sphenostylis stenocarpa]